MRRTDNVLRPGGVTAIAVLNIIFGVFFTLAYLCGGLLLLFIYVFITNEIQQNPDNRALQELNEFLGVYLNTLQDHVPGIIPYMITSVVFDFTMTLLLLVSGIGLLSLRPWARSMCIFYAVASIIWAVGASGYTLAIVNPGLQNAQTKLEEHLEQRFKGKVKVQTQQQNQQLQIITNSIGSVFGMVARLAYPIAVLIVMMLASTRKAFSDSRGIDLPHVEHDDIYDYERRRLDDESQYL